MKILKALLFMACLALMPKSAFAGTNVFESAVSSGTLSPTVVRCSTGTAIRIDNLANPSGVKAWLRVMNQDASNKVWLGFDNNVSTNPAAGNLGERLAADGGSAVYAQSRDVQLWCKAADAAGASGCILSLAAWGN